MTENPGRTPRLRRWVASGAAAALLLSGCTLLPGPSADKAPDTGAVTADPDAVGDVPAGLEPFYSQEVEWEPCEDDFACARVEVPLDYSDPGRATIEVAAIRADATKGEPQGTILVNPGGPGGSGYNIVRDALDRVVSDRLRGGYDVVGFDPRGVNRSSAVECRTDKEQDAAREEFIPADTPDGEALELLRAEAREYADVCAERTGELLGFVDTDSAARDMDILRALVGDAKLNYLGFSYGTQLGAAYAGLFPERSGRLVLDGALDPALSNEQVTLGQAAAFEKALRAYVAGCQAGDDCPLPGDVDAGVAALQDLFQEVEENPKPAEDGRLVTIGSFVQGFILPLYDDSNWPTLTSAVNTALQGDYTDMMYLADLAFEREADGTYSTNATDAFLAVNCLDYPMVSDPDQMRRDEAALVAASPTFGAFLAYGGLTCEAWKYGPVGEPAPARAQGADPLLVIGTTGDPATPYEWSLALAEQLESAVHVTWEGEGHTAYGRSNDCITDIVDSYFLEGAVPKDGVRC
ncbi:alpha/beta hydrolase [Arthrobacter zhaoguopingii]|uniref:alpha/beta hydrolase n=1 Tax=Arthrobacter zhaoguopingii TaxID=2681491 RepID=UPI001359D60F|nr:alpha/beta hydrolase [Arthrobacter zhaoguopingii]